MCYIGSTYNFGKRRLRHIYDSKRGMRNVNRAIREFGFGAFDFEIIEQCDKSIALAREEFWISFFNSAGLEGFNTLAKPTASFGILPSPISRQRMSVAHKGIPFSAERLARHRAAKSHPDYRAKLSALVKQRYKDNPEYLAKAREIIKRVAVHGPMSQERKDKIGRANSGKKRSPECVEEMRSRAKSRVRIPHSAETRRKIGEANKAAWLRKQAAPLLQ